MNSVKYEWDEETGVALCTLRTRDGKTFVGTAYCAEEDEDVKSKFTGSIIAYNRALIKELIDERDNIIIPGLKALKELYYSINKSKKYNRYSYEAIMLYNKIQQYEDDLTYIRSNLKRIKAELSEYINGKQVFANSLRKIRNNGQKEEIISNENL